MAINSRVSRSDSKAATEYLLDIIHDFEEHYVGGNLPVPQRNPYALANKTPFNNMLTSRFNQFMASSSPPQPRLHRFIFLGLLSTSSTFMKVFDDEHSQADGKWTALLTQLDTHMNAITFYGRSRCLPWNAALINYFNAIHDTGPDSTPFRSLVWPNDVPVHPMGLDDTIFYKKHPHTFCLLLNGGTLACQSLSGPYKHSQMVNVAESEYNIQNWPPLAPNTWPARRWYPDHPQNARNGTPNPTSAANANEFFICGFCYRSFVAVGSIQTGCTCFNWRVAHPRVQVHEIPPYPGQPCGVNKGLVAMQTFRKGEIIGEYVGLLLPPEGASIDIYGNPFADNVYAMSLCAQEVELLRDGSEITMQGIEIANISAAWLGNFSRFINTSQRKSDWNIEFQHLMIANRVRVVLRVLKDIEFGDELLASYGSEYMKDLFGDSWK